jgi:RecB family exonuclease
MAVLDGLAEALARYDDVPRSHEALASVVHHAIESQTFAPGLHHAGVHLVDAVSARFGEFNDVYLVGLVDTDWAERPRRNVFYAATLLKSLGWPQEPDQIRAQQAAFRDVLTLAHDRTRLSAFQLEGDTLVALSTMIDAVRGLPTLVESLPPRRPIFADELLTRPTPPVPTEPDLAEWLAWRRQRPPLSAPAYSGMVAARRSEVYRVSRVDRYVVCPFKYFAEHVLGLPEERDEAAGLTPLERGTLMHAIFERFYRAWQEGPGGAITAENLPEAERLFAAVADASLAGLPDTDRTLEQMRLVGSIVSPGVADRVFALEVAASAGVVERLIESELNGRFRFPVRGGLDERLIEIRGKTDRIDVLDDGTLRVIDYKLGRMPDVDSSVQIGVYAHCARQWIEQRDGRPHPVSAASYLAFGDEHKFEGRIARTPTEVEQAVLAKAGAFATVIEHIEAGEFPPRPRTLAECQWCGFAGICRKEYRVEEAVDDTAEPV